VETSYDAAVTWAGNVRKWYSGPNSYRRIGYTALAAGVVLSIVTAIRAAVSQNPSLGTSVLLAVAAAGFQLGGAFAFKNDGREGRAHDTLVKSTTTRLLRLGLRSQQAGQFAQEAFESPSATKQDLKVVLGQLSVRIDGITDRAYEALEDWQFHPAAVHVDTDVDLRIRPDSITPPPEGAQDDDNP